MRKTETVELTVLCLIEDENKILLQNKVKKDWQGYALPGGHVEPGESFVNAVVREINQGANIIKICCEDDSVPYPYTDDNLNLRYAVDEIDR